MIRSKTIAPPQSHSRNSSKAPINDNTHETRVVVRPIKTFAVRRKRLEYVSHLYTLSDRKECFRDDGYARFAFSQMHKRARVLLKQSISTWMRAIFIRIIPTAIASPPASGKLVKAVAFRQLSRQSHRTRGEIVRALDLYISICG